jgi:hypothetical protein
MLFRSLHVALIATLISSLIPLTASAQTQTQTQTQTSPDAVLLSSRDPFEHHVAIAGYSVAWAGAYPAAGVGGRIRGEYPHVVGVDLFAEHLAVQWPGGGFRHDHPIGFNLEKPFQITRSMRLRPMLGMCAVFSFIEPEHPGGPRADDIMFGVHAGLGMEVALHQYWSFFMEAQGVAYLAHDRSSQNWTGSVSQGVHTAGVFQPSMGLQIHYF